MKTVRKVTHCVRCGDLLSRHERKHSAGGELCAFCDQIRSEALQIYQDNHRGKWDERRLGLI